MEIILFILIFLISLGSLITTFTAIFQILNNDFKDSKGFWIVISMIAVIGPILWLTKGRKLIVKVSPGKRLEMKHNFPVKNHYAALLKESRLIKLLSLTAIVMILLGYLMKALSIYFFWEIKAIGFIALLISFATLLIHDARARKAKKIKNTWSIIGFGVICFFLFIKGLMLIILPNSDAYAAAKKQIMSNAELTSEIGAITGMSVLPSGRLHLMSNNSGTYGTASLELIIKGANKYLERTVFLEKTPDKDWEIIGMEE